MSLDNEFTPTAYDCNGNEIEEKEGYARVQGKDSFCYVKMPTFTAEFVYKIEGEKDAI